MAAANLDIEAVVRDRLAKIGLSDKVKPALIDGGVYTTLGKIAFAVSATPQTLTDAAVDNWADGLTTPIGIILGLYWGYIGDNGKYNGNYYNGYVGVI